MSAYLLKASLFSAGTGGGRTGAQGLERAAFGLGFNGDDLHLEFNVDPNVNTDLADAQFGDKPFPFMTPGGLMGLTNFCLITGQGFTAGDTWTGEIILVARPVAPPFIEESAGSYWEPSTNYIKDTGTWAQIPEAYGQKINAATPTNGPFFFLGQDATNQKCLCGPVQLGWYIKNAAGAVAGSSLNWSSLKFFVPLGSLQKLA